MKIRWMSIEALVWLQNSTLGIFNAISDALENYKET